MATEAKNPSSRHLPHVEIRDGVRRWKSEARDAFVGLLQTHRRLVREMDADLERRHGLSFTAFEVLIRLASESERMLRLSELADGAGLSLSRISRVVDQLERQEWVERRACSSDRRGVHAYLTGSGLQKLREAQQSHFAGVEELFFSRVDETEIAMLAEIFGRYAPETSDDATGC